MADAIGPGAIVFAVMPLTKDARAKTAVSAWTPPSEAPYAALLDRSSASSRAKGS
jgi:hypothetical protein